MTYVTDDASQGAYTTAPASGRSAAWPTAPAPPSSSPSPSTPTPAATGHQHGHRRRRPGRQHRSDDSAIVDFTVTDADLSITKTVSDATPNENDTISYTITVTNNGPDAATGVVVTDLLPGGVDLRRPTSPARAPTYDGTGVWTVGGLANGASATLVITVTVDADTGGNPSPTRPRSTATRTTTTLRRLGDFVDFTVTDADLVITKTVSDTTPDENDRSPTRSPSPTTAPTPPPGGRGDLLPGGVDYVTMTPAGRLSRRHRRLDGRRPGQRRQRDPRHHRHRRQQHRRRHGHQHGHGRRRPGRQHRPTTRPPSTSR